MIVHQKTISYREDIEIKIISMAFGYNMYNKVTFLQPSDFVFSNHEQIFNEIIKCKGDYKKMLKAFPDMDILVSAATYINIRTLGLLLIEESIKSEISGILFECSNHSDAIESRFLTNVSDEIKQSDAIAICDHIVPYIQHICQKSTVNKVKTSIEKWRKRIVKIKKIIENE